MSHLMCAVGRRILGAGIDNGVIGKQNCQFWSILVNSGEIDQSDRSCQNGQKHSSVNFCTPMELMVVDHALDQ